MQIFKGGALENANKTSSEYIKPYIFYFPQVYLTLLIIFPFCPSSTLYVKLLIDTDTQIDLIRRDITKKLGLKIVKIEIPQHIVSCFGREASKKLWYRTLFILTSLNNILWKSNIVYMLVTNKLAYSMLFDLIFIYFNQLIIDAKTKTIINKHYGHNIITSNSKILTSPTLIIKMLDIFSRFSKKISIFKN